MLTWQRAKLAFEGLGQRPLSTFCLCYIFTDPLQILIQEVFAPLILFWKMWNKHSSENSSQTVEILLMVFIFQSFHVHTQGVAG